MAPVTGGVSHGKKDELVLAAGLLESLLAPGIPEKSTHKISTLW